MSLRATHIVPRFHPQIDGLGDYAGLLAGHLDSICDIESDFMVGDPEWRSSLELPNERRCRQVGPRSASDLAAKLDGTDTLILHYVGYGYDQSGLPWWLEAGVRRWKHGCTNRRLVVVFHELWASGSPLRREFYTSFLQRWIVVRLQKLCDLAVTSVAVMRATLDKIQPGKTTLLPIPSPFPEAPLYPARRETSGPRQLIVFGQEPSRILSITAHEQLIRSLRAQGMLESVAVVGKNANNGAAPSRDVEMLRRFVPTELIRAFPDVTPSQGAKLLRAADLFLSYYPSAYLCKSSALMAALSNGCVPVIPEARHAAPLRDRVEVVACGPRERDAAELLSWIRTGGLRVVSENGWAWYQANASWRAVAGVFADLLRSVDARGTDCPVSRVNCA